jgi:hypothetical protein
MPSEYLHAEAVASTLLLSTPPWHAKPLFDPRPGLLVAQLSADRHWRASHDLRDWQREYERVLALLGWRHMLQEQIQPMRSGRSAVLLHEHLARGLTSLCHRQWAPAVARTLKAIAATGQHSAALDILVSHGWHLGQLNLQVALLDTDGTLLTFGLSDPSGARGPLQGLNQRVPTAARRLRMRSSVATLNTDLYAKVLDDLRAKLADRSSSAMAPFPHPLESDSTLQ